MPFESLRRVFDKLQASPALLRRVNGCTPAGKAPNVKVSPLLEENLKHPGVDRKLPLDMSAERLQALSQDPELLVLLKIDFAAVMAFYDFVEKQVCPAVSEALVCAAQGSFNFRMLEYFPTGESACGCSAHKDYGTFTVIAADMPGLQCELDGTWVDVCQTNTLTILFGWCAYMMSGEVIPAAHHRVVDSAGEAPDGWTRRLSFSLSFSTFVAPPRDYDLKAHIRPAYVARPHHRAGAEGCDLLLVEDP